MDPDATLRRYWAALARGDHDEADEARDALLEWLNRGGFQPDWAKSGHSRIQFYHSKPDARRSSQQRRARTVRAPREERLDSFTRAYMETALWAENDESDPETGGNPLDDDYSISDIAPGTKTRMIADCADFQERFGELISGEGVNHPSETEDELAGRDFWLTRQGHGAGFWDGDWPKNGDALTAAAKEYGQVWLYVGDDGKVYASGGGHEANERRRSVGERRMVHARPETSDDPEYIIQGLYSNGDIAYPEHGYNDERIAIRAAKELAGSSWFEGDYVRVMTRDGELAWTSEGDLDQRTAEQHRRVRAPARLSADLSRRIGRDAVDMIRDYHSRGFRDVRITTIANGVKMDGYRDIGVDQIRNVIWDLVQSGKILSQGKNKQSAYLRLPGYGQHRRHKVKDYIAVDRRDRVVGGPSKDKEEMKRKADLGGGVVKFVPSTREPRRSAHRAPGKK